MVLRELEKKNASEIATLTTELNSWKVQVNNMPRTPPHSACVLTTSLSLSRSLARSCTCNPSGVPECEQDVGGR
jgi:hypothetical protein